MEPTRASAPQRVVGRSELQSEEDLSPSSSPGPEAADTLKQLGTLDFVKKENIPAQALPGANDGVDDDEMDFCLFAPSKPTTATEQQAKDTGHKIRLRSPSLERLNQGFVSSNRDPTYYFTAPSTPDQAYQLQATALSGEAILARSHTSWPGSVYAWKVLRIPASQAPGSAKTDTPLLFHKLVDSSLAPSKRTRPGKKYRLKQRKKLAAKADAKTAAAAKEEAEKEKRTRRNREKKVKKKAKEKAKKVDAGEGGEGGHASGLDGEGSET